MSPLWHGGAPGLRVGDLIESRPDGDTRHLVDGCPECEARKQGRTTLVDAPRPDCVYVTIDRDYARLYANGYPRGGLYRVEAIGPLESDTSNPRQPQSWAVPAARILSVYDPVVIMSDRWLRRAVRLWC